MSIRLRVFLITAVIVLTITLAGVIISIVSTQNQIHKTLEGDMRLVASLVNEYISGEVNMLKVNAASVAERLKNTQSEELSQVLIEQVAAYEHFEAISILSPSGKTEAFYGVAPAPEEVVIDEYGRKVFAGQRVISTSYMDTAGRLFFYVLAPFDDYQYKAGEEDTPSKAVVCTVSGLFFSEQLSRFLIWDTGNIALSDRYGTIIANVQNEWVLQRLNFTEIAKYDRRYEGAARSIERMIKGELGTDRFSLEGVNVVITYMPVTASEQGWSLAIIAPVKESPIYKARIMVLIAGMVFLGLGLIAAVIASGYIAKHLKGLPGNIADRHTE